MPFSTLFTSVFFLLTASGAAIDWAEARELECRPVRPNAHARHYGMLVKLHATYNTEAMLMGERILPNGQKSVRDYGNGEVRLHRTLPPSLTGNWAHDSTQAKARMSVWPKDGHDIGDPRPKYSWEGAFLLEGRFAYDVECTDPYVKPQTWRR